MNILLVSTAWRLLLIASSFNTVQGCRHCCIGNSHRAVNSSQTEMQTNYKANELQQGQTNVETAF